MTRFNLRPEPVGEDISKLEAPPDWDALFGFSGPLELEVGCGLGGYALGYAARHPHVRYVAFEWRKKFAREVQARADLKGLKNLKVVEADARGIVPKIFRPGSLSQFHFQFPDPWWKRTHQKRAVLTPDFAQLLMGLIQPGGIVEVRTDVEDRAHRMLATLEGAGFENPLGKGAFHPPDPEEIPSTRERRYLISGQPVYRARLVRPSA